MNRSDCAFGDGHCASGTPVLVSLSHSFTLLLPYSTMSSPSRMVSVYQSRRACALSSSMLPSHRDVTTALMASNKPSGSVFVTAMKAGSTIKMAFSCGEHIDRITR